MAVINLPVPPEGVGKYQYRKEIDNVFYRFLFKWNARNRSWYFDLADDTGTAILRSRRVVLAINILGPFKHLKIPQGSLDIVDTTGEHLEPTKDDLGTRVLVQYTQVA